MAGEKPEVGLESSSAAPGLCRIRRRLPRSRRCGRTSASAAVATGHCPRRTTRPVRTPKDHRIRSLCAVLHPYPVPAHASPTHGTPNIGRRDGKASAPCNGPMRNGERYCCEGVACLTNYVTNATIVRSVEKPSSAYENLAHNRHARSDRMPGSSGARLRAPSPAVPGTMSRPCFAKWACAPPASAWRSAGSCSARATGT